MNKKLQMEINEFCEHEFDLAMKEFDELRGTGYCSYEKFRSCSAEIIFLKNYVLLRSYNTIVACISMHTFICFDLLRKVYGYTSTSAQHIAKFKHDFGAGQTYTWRYV